MAANYWIKLYHEILNDPKMARLSDRTWRRTIELFLLAGSLGNSGMLPEIEEIAWSLRVSTGSLKKDISILQDAGIVQKVEGGWLVTNFAKRNAPATVAERVRKHRETKQNKLCNEDVTKEKRLCNEDVTKSYTDTDTDTDTDIEPPLNPPLSGETESAAASSETPDFDPGRVYRQVTGQFTIPSSETPKVLPALFAFRDNGMSEGEMIDFLKPYFEAWKNRRGKNGSFYSTSNCTWLYDWAVAKQIPAQTVSEEKPKTVIKFNHLGEPIEVPL